MLPDDRKWNFMASDLGEEAMRAAIIAVLAGTLTACATVQEEYAHLSTSGTYYDICYDATDGRPGAVNRKEAAARVIKERGIECDWALFAQIHQTEAARNLAMVGAGVGMMRAAQPQAKTQVYIVNGRRVTCTKVGIVTNCI